MSEDEKPADKPQERRRMVRLPTGGTASGRKVGQKIKTADKKSLSSQAWIKRQLSDEWSDRARAEGWRSRAAFKLMEIDDKFRLIRHGSRVIDLGAAPGGWVQVALDRGAAAVAGASRWCSARWRPSCSSSRGIMALTGGAWAGSR